MKRFYEALGEQESNPSDENSKQVDERMAAAFSKIDKAVKRGVYHRNGGARRKAQLAKARKRLDSPQDTAVSA